MFAILIAVCLCVSATAATILVDGSFEDGTRNYLEGPLGDPASGWYTDYEDMSQWIVMSEAWWGWTGLTAQDGGKFVIADPCRDDIGWAYNRAIIPAGLYTVEAYISPIVNTAVDMHAYARFEKGEQRTVLIDHTKKGWQRYEFTLVNGAAGYLAIGVQGTGSADDMLAFDNVAIYAVEPTPAPPEPTEPTVRLTAPGKQTTVLAGSPLSMIAEVGEQQISRVVFEVWDRHGYHRMLTDRTAPYYIRWRVPPIDDTLYFVRAWAYDNAGGIGYSDAAWVLAITGR